MTNAMRFTDFTLRLFNRFWRDDRYMMGFKLNPFGQTPGFRNGLERSLECEIDGNDSDDDRPEYSADEWY